MEAANICASSRRSSEAGRSAGGSRRQRRQMIQIPAQVQTNAVARPVHSFVSTVAQTPFHVRMHYRITPQARITARRAVRLLWDLRES